MFDTTTTKTFEVVVKGDASGLKKVERQANSTFRNLDSHSSRASRTFSRIGTAAKLGIGVGVVAAFAEGKKAIEAYGESYKIAKQTEAVIKSTGKSANVTAEQVGKLSEKLAMKSGIDDEAIQKGANLLLTFKEIKNEVGKGNDIFNQTTKIMVDMSVAMDQDFKSSAIQLGKALNEPVKGMSALSRVGVTFNDQQKKSIETFVKQNKLAEAQKVILKELKSEFGGSAAAQATAMGKLNVVVGNLEEKLGEKLFPVVQAVSREMLKFANIINSPKLSATQKFDKIKERLAELATEGFQKLVQAAAKFGPKIGISLAEGILHSWTSFNPLEKLFAAGILIRAIGGKGALLAAGRYIGGIFGLGITEGATAGVATAGAEGAAAGAAGGAAAGGLGGALSKWGSKAVKVAGGVLGGIFVAEFGANVIEELTGADILEGQDIVTSLTHGFNTSGVKETEERALAHAKQMERIRNKINRIQSGLFTGGDIGKQGNKVQSDIAQNVKKGSSEARQYTAMNLRAMAHAYQTNMDQSGNITKKGMARIRNLIHKADLMQAGKSQAVAFGNQWAKGMEHSKDVTKGGVQKIMHELRLMPAASRQVAAQTWLAQMKEAKDKGDITKQQFRQLRSKVVSEFEGIKVGGIKSMKDLMNMLPNFGKQSQHQVGDIGSGAWGKYKNAVSTTASSVKSNVRGIDRATTGSMTDMIGKLNAGLIALNVQPVVVGKQRGGNIGGHGSGDKVPAMLEPGEYVLNRNAVAAVGKETLDGINFTAAPRFQKGGILGSEPHISGQGTVKNAGQNAIHKLYKAAKRYYNLHNGKARVIQNGNRMDALHQPYLWGGGHGATASVNGPWDCSGGISELFNGAGWNFAPMVSGGFQTWGLPGPGDITVFANPEHVYATIDGKGAIGTSGENPGGGFGWISGYTSRPGFTLRHANYEEQDGKMVLSSRRGKGQKQKKGFQSGGIVGKATWFNGGATAGGSSTSQPGLALNLNPGTDSGWNNDTTQGWMDASRSGHPVFARVSIGGKTANLPITDLGPAGWTGNAIDVTEGGVKKLGFTTDNFPSGTVGKATILGSGSAGGGKEHVGPHTKRQTHRIKVIQNKAKKVLEEARKLKHQYGTVGGTKAGEKALEKSLKFSKMAAEAKKLGNKEQAEKFIEKAQGALEKSRSTLKAAAAGVFEKGLKPSKLLPSAHGLPSQIQNRLKARGLTYAGKLALGEEASEMAGRTEGSGDDLAAFAFQKELIQRNKKRLQKALAQVNKALGGKMTKAQRAKLLGKRAHIEEELGQANQGLAGIREGESSLAEEEQNAAIERQTEEIEKAREVEEQRIQVEKETQEAMKALEKELAENRYIAESEAGVSAAVARTAIADIVSGQLGPRTNLKAQTAGSGTVGTF